MEILYMTRWQPGTILPKKINFITNLDKQLHPL